MFVPPCCHRPGAVPIGLLTFFPRIHSLPVHDSSSPEGVMEAMTNGDSPIKKQEDDDKGEKRDIKPIPKTLNRVPRK